jgi:hypothetical protein
VKFSLDARWLLPDGEEISSTHEFAAIDIVRASQRWGKDREQGPLEVIVLEPNQRFPDFKTLNDAVPRDQWLTGLNGEPRGPWQGVFFVYLLDLSTMGRLTYIANASTIGAAIAVRELADKTKWMRRIKGDDAIWGVVTLGDVFMNTRFGGRQRQHFNFVRFIKFGPSGEVKQLESPEQQKLEQLGTGESVGMQTVEPPSRKEELKDSVPF